MTPYPALVTSIFFKGLALFHVKFLGRYRTTFLWRPVPNVARPQICTRSGGLRFVTQIRLYRVIVSLLHRFLETALCREDHFLQQPRVSTTVKESSLGLHLIQLQYMDKSGS